MRALTRAALSAGSRRRPHPQVAWSTLFRRRVIQATNPAYTSVSHPRISDLAVEETGPNTTAMATTPVVSSTMPHVRAAGRVTWYGMYRRTSGSCRRALPRGSGSVRCAAPDPMHTAAGTIARTTTTTLRPSGTRATRYSDHVPRLRGRPHPSSTQGGLRLGPPRQMDLR